MLWYKKNDLTITTAIQPYLYRAVVNAAFNHIRKTNPFSEFDSSLHDKAETTGTSEVLEYRETAQKVSSIIDNLPPACRTVFLLSREDGLSYKEIAETLSISVKTVENQMTKALRLLRENLLEILFLIISSLIFY